MEKLRALSAFLISSALASDIPKPPRPTDPCATVNIIAAAERQTRRDRIHAFVPEIQQCSPEQIRGAADLINNRRPKRDEDWATEYVLYRTAREVPERTLAERE